jgi:hypothetical protein
MPGYRTCRSSGCPDMPHPSQCLLSLACDFRATRLLSNPRLQDPAEIHLYRLYRPLILNPAVRTSPHLISPLATTSSNCSVVHLTGDNRWYGNELRLQRDRRFGQRQLPDLG